MTKSLVNSKLTQDSLLNLRKELQKKYKNMVKNPHKEQMLPISDELIVREIIFKINSCLYSKYPN